MPTAATSGRQVGPVVATVTVGTDERRWLPRCLGSILEAPADAVRTTVHLIDNASTDGTAELVSDQFPAAVVTATGARLGFAAANNIGIRNALAAGAQYVFLVNPDTWTPPNLIRDLVAFMRQWPEYGIVGPMQYRYHSTSPALRRYNAWSEEALRSAERHVFWADWPAHPSPAHPTTGRAPNTFEHSYVQGAAFFVRAEVFRDVGLFDEVFHTYYEEVDLCRRARWAGWRVALLRDLGIQHQGGGGAGAGRYRRVMMRRNRYYYLFTDVDWRAGPAVRLAGRWLLGDLCGRGVAGRTSPWRGLVETLGALGWLGRRIPVIRARRRAYRQLRAAARST